MKAKTNEADLQEEVGGRITKLKAIIDSLERFLRKEITVEELEKELCDTSAYYSWDLIPDCCDEYEANDAFRNVIRGFHSSYCGWINLGEEHWYE